MKRSNKFVRSIILCLPLIAVVLTGCASMDSAYRGTTGIVNPDKVRLQTNLEWLTPPTSMGLRMPAGTYPTVFYRYRNTAGLHVPGLHERIIGSLTAAGYNVTNDPEQAHFILTTDVRYFGETREKDGTGALLTGAALGGVTGAVVGHNVGSGYGREGAVAGAVLGAAVGNVMANRNKMVEIALAVDVRIGERVNGNVETTRRTQTSGDVGQAAAIRMASGSETGHSSGESREDQALRVQDQFLYHNNRVVVSGRKMALTPEEALPVLSDRLSLALSSVLP